MMYTLTALVVLAYQGMAVLAATCTTSLVPVATISQPLSNGAFANSLAATGGTSQPYTSFYNTPIDLQNGFSAEFDLNIGISGVTAGQASASNYPVLKIELSGGIPGVLSGSSYAITVSPAGVVAGPTGTVTNVNQVLTGGVRLVLTYTSAGSITLVNGGTTLFSATGVTIATTLGNNGVGYIGLASVIDPFVTVGWTLDFSSFTLSTYAPSTTNSAVLPTNGGALTAQTITAGNTVTYSLQARDSCNQPINSPATIAHAFSLALVNGAGVSVAGTIATSATATTGVYPVAFQLNNTGIYNLNAQAGGAAIGGTIPPGLVTVNAGALSPLAAVLDYSPEVDTSKQPTITHLYLKDIFNNNITAQPAGGPLYIAILTSADKTQTGSVAANVSWSTTLNAYEFSVNIPKNGTYDLSVFPVSSTKQIDKSPFVITASLFVPGSNVVQNSNTLAIVAGVIAAIIVILAIYGLWRGLRYRQKHREGKLREEQAIHQAKVKKHEAEVAASVLANPLVVTDQGGYVTQQQVEEAQKKADYQESLANIERLEVERLEVAIKLKQEQIAQIKKKKQEDEILSAGLKAKPAPKKKNEFGQKAS